MNHADDYWSPLQFQAVVSVRLRVMLAIMNMWVGVDSPTMLVDVHVQMSTAKNFPQRICSEHDQHQPNDELKGEAYPITDFNMQQDDERAGHQERNRMANSPERADKRRADNARVLARDGGYGGHVIGFDGMLQPQHKSKCQDRNDRKVVHLWKS